MSNNKYIYDLNVAPEGMSFLLDNLGADANPLQYIRELTQNSIDAVEKTKTQGKILWAVDPDIYKSSDEQLSKLSLIDNGVGMTGEEMVKHINRLASSSGEQSYSGNFGIGAKITAGVKNKHGLVYTSWKDGVGAKVHFFFNPETQKYGLKPLKRSDGSTGSWTDIVDSDKPSLIKGHGTKVTLLGLDNNENTALPKGQSEGWISKYLANHYVDFPQDVNVYVSSKPTNKLVPKDRVQGKFDYLQNNSESAGRVQLAGANAHWWLLNEVEHNTPVGNKGHVGLLFQNELYETKLSRAGHSLLSQSGIIAGPTRVVIYFEPIANGQTVKPSTARGGILIDSEAPPYADWAAEFADKMPDDLKAYMDKVLDKSSNSMSDSLRKRIDSLSALFKLNVLNPKETGETGIDKDDRDLDGQQNNSSDPNDSAGSSDLKDPVKPKSPLAKLFKENNDNADKGTPKKKLILPNVRWVNALEDSDLEDRAAKYNPRSHEILINEEFVGYKDFLSLLQKEYQGDDLTAKAVENSLREYYSQVLAQAVLGVKDLSVNGEHLLSDYENDYLTPEALTTAVMVRIEMRDNVVKTLRSQGVKPINGTSEQFPHP